VGSETVRHDTFALKTFLVTGANRGIGLEYCRQLQQRGDQVIAVCRTPSPELEALGVDIKAGVDLTRETAVADLVNRLEGLPLDGVILNAGVLEASSLEHLDPDSLRRQFEVNALAPLRLTQALLGQLQAGSKLILMTSRMGSIDDNSSGGSYGYRMSKVALNMAGRSLAIDLRPRGIAVAILHPGLVRTRMVNFNAQGISPEQAVRGLLQRIDALTLETSGTFWHANGDVLPW
jgi:NAD(P)-dependent dehydrogenase (short-subunit alcohol dehydrogenase family)